MAVVLWEISQEFATPFFEENAHRRHATIQILRRRGFFCFVA